jgi:enoyl-CoA hydratase/carnithine racemase
VGATPGEYSGFPCSFAKRGEFVVSDIEITVEDQVATITLNRPAQRNAVTLAMWLEVAELFERFAEDPAVRAIILTGAGADFSSGADISEFRVVRDTPEQSVEYERTVDRCSESIVSTPKPTIAAVRGYCLGGGCHLAMACDFRFAEPSALFGIPAARLSIVYGVRSTQRLLALVGLARAKRVLFSAENFGADEAVRMGFADRSVVDALQSATELARVMARNAPLSVAGAKAILTGLTEGLGALDPEQAQAMIDHASDSDDYREGRQAFLEKRLPVFRGQ